MDDTEVKFSVIERGEQRWTRSSMQAGREARRRKELRPSYLTRFQGSRFPDANSPDLVKLHNNKSRG